MFGLFGFGVSEKTAKEQAERRDREMKDRVSKAVAWTPNLPWQPKMTLKADSWPEWKLFDVEPTVHGDINNEPEPAKKLALSPSGEFAFCMKTLPFRSGLRTLQGSRRGDVFFDGPIALPALHQKRYDGRWRDAPWMSITPMEVMTQRPGTKLARGHVVVAGLGLGWGLCEVLKKRTVTKVTLVEKSQELVDWILGTGFHRLHWREGVELEVIVGDAHDVLVDYKADVALIDIFPNYGSNDFLARNNKRPRNIPTVWCWGSAPIADEPRRWF